MSRFRKRIALQQRGNKKQVTAKSRTKNSTKNEKRTKSDVLKNSGPARAQRELTRMAITTRNTAIHSIIMIMINIIIVPLFNLFQQPTICCLSVCM